MLFKAASSVCVCVRVRVCVQSLKLWEKVSEQGLRCLDILHNNQT